MFGNCYRLRLSGWEGGEERSRVQTPEEDWSCEEEPARMPRYADCEQQAYEALTGHGVPPALGVLPARVRELT